MAVWYAQYVEKSIVLKKKNNSSYDQIGDLKEISEYRIMFRHNIFKNIA